jgi:hypothetical protein
MKYSYYIIKISALLILIFISMISLSCEKVVDIDLDSASPRIVIEGKYREGFGSVSISQTNDISETKSIPVSESVVDFSDNIGNKQTIKVNPGMYTSWEFKGEPGRTYTMKVSYNGKVYTSSSTLPELVKIDSARNGVDELTGNKAINLYFKDPPGIRNYYYIRESAPSFFYNFTADDYQRDGKSIKINLTNIGYTLNPGDNVDISLESVDKGVYEYFRTLELIFGYNGMRSASPANPITNFDNGALGYFSAYSESTTRITIK